MTGKSEKTVSSLNLECWIWDMVERMDENRSRFFNNLIKSEIKRELISQRLMTESDEVSEMYGELYLKIILARRSSKDNIRKRKHVRSKCLQSDPKFNKRPISIRMDKWLWNICGKVEHNRSLFFKKIILLRIKNESIRLGLVNENNFKGKDHDEQFLMTIVRDFPIKKIS